MGNYLFKQEKISIGRIFLDNYFLIIDDVLLTTAKLTFPSSSFTNDIVLFFSILLLENDAHKKCIRVKH